MDNGSDCVYVYVALKINIQILCLISWLLFLDSVYFAYVVSIGFIDDLCDNIMALGPHHKWHWHSPFVATIAR